MLGTFTKVATGKNSPIISLAFSEKRNHGSLRTDRPEDWPG